MVAEEKTGVIEKIKKLFSMANRATNHDGSSNQIEASAAMAKAQELLTKYNLDLRSVQDSVQPGMEMSGGRREKVKINRSAMYRWQQIFWKELAEANYCFHWVTVMYENSRKVKRHVILGSEGNVAAVQAMGEYLTETIERELPYPNTERLSNAALSWREGMAIRLIERIQEKMEALKREGFKSAEGAQVTGLAVQDLHVKEYAANYDAQYGAGAYARMKQNQADYEQRSAERRASAAEEQARQLAGETPEQRVKREKAEARVAAKQQARDAAWWDRHYRREQRKAARLNIAAYSRGVHKAETVNLDLQVKGGSRD